AHATYLSMVRIGPANLVVICGMKRLQVVWCFHCGRLRAFKWMKLFKQILEINGLHEFYLLLMCLEANVNTYSNYEQLDHKAHSPDAVVVVRDAYTSLYSAQLEILCLMVANMTHELQKNFQDYNAMTYEGLYRPIEAPCFSMPKALRVSLIINSLSKDYEQFVQNYNMHNMGKTIAELHAMLKLAEKDIPKKAHTALVVLAIKIGMIKKKAKGLRGSMEMKHRALNMYINNWNCAAIEAIESFDLILPKGLVIVLDNCHFTHSITMGVVLISCLVDNGLPNDIYSLIDSNETDNHLWDTLERQMRSSEYAEQDRKAAILYEYDTFKATEGEQLLDTYLRYLQVINDLKKCGYKKDNCELNYKFLNNLQPEWKQYGTLMRQTKNLMDINIDALYNILKQNQEKVKVQTESEGSDDEDISDLKNITALLAKSFNRKKYYAKPTNNNLRTSSASYSANKKPEYVKSVEKKEDKKVDEKKRDISKVKCYNCKKE
nr:hypothetical protein [Tanacetum cinerariifolium]